MTSNQINQKRKSEEPIPISSTSTSILKNKNKKRKHSNHTSPSSPSSSSSSSANDHQSIKNQLNQIQLQLNQTQSQLADSQKDSQSKAELLDSIRSSLRCNICFETFNSPYTLLCGHIFCHKDLYAWFHRLPSDYDTELEFDISDLDEYTNNNEPRRENRDQGRLIVSTLNENPPIETNPPEASSTNTTNNEAPPRIQPPRPSAYRKKKNLICPQCRTAVHTAPFQLYAIKEATDHLRKDEGVIDTTGNSETPIRHDPEAHRDEKDVTWGNIFLGSNRLPRPVVHDVEDGVRRCGQCNWEIAADGICEGCGEIYSDVNDSDDGNSENSDGRWAGQSQQSNSSFTDRSNESVYDSDQHHFHQLHRNTRRLIDLLRARDMMRLDEESDDQDMESSDQDHSDDHHEQRVHSSGVIDSDDSDETCHHNDRHHRRRVIESDDSEDRSDSVEHLPHPRHVNHGPDHHPVIDVDDLTSDSRDYDNYNSDASRRGRPSQSDDSDDSEQSSERGVDDRRYPAGPSRGYRQGVHTFNHHDDRSDSFEGSEESDEDDHSTIHDERDQDSEESQYEGPQHQDDQYRRSREWSEQEEVDDEDDSDDRSYDDE